MSEKKLKSDNDEEAGIEVKADEAEVQAEGDEDGDGDVSTAPTFGFRRTTGRLSPSLTSSPPLSNELGNLNQNRCQWACCELLLFLHIER